MRPLAVLASPTARTPTSSGTWCSRRAPPRVALRHRGDQPVARQHAAALRGDLVEAEAVAAQRDAGVRRVGQRHGLGALLAAAASPRSSSTAAISRAPAGRSATPARPGDVGMPRTSGRARTSSCCSPRAAPRRPRPPRSTSAAAGRGSCNPAFIPWRSLRAEALARLGRRDEAMELAAAEVEIARRWGAPSPIARALRALGLAAGGDEGLAYLEQAVETVGGLGGPPRGGQGARRAGRRAAPCAAAERVARAAAPRARARRRLRRRRARRARALRALRDRRAAAHDGAAAARRR